MFILLILSFNKTFFKTYYNSDFIDNMNIPILRYTYYRGTGELDKKIKLLELEKVDRSHFYGPNYHP